MAASLSTAGALITARAPTLCTGRHPSMFVLLLAGMKEHVILSVMLTSLHLGWTPSMSWRCNLLHVCRSPGGTFPSSERSGNEVLPGMVQVVPDGLPSHASQPSPQDGYSVVMSGATFSWVASTGT